MKVFLDVDRGPATGTFFELRGHACRAIGRLGDGDAQATLVDPEGQPLDPDDQARVDAHLARRDAARPITKERSELAFSRASDILLDDHMASRVHAMVFLDADGPSLVDLGSTNGTFVNRRPVTDADLHDGDIIHIGRSRFTVRFWIDAKRSNADHRNEP